MDTFYPVKHWLLTLAVGPVVVSIYEFFLSNDTSVFFLLEAYPPFLIIGFIFSIPMLLVYYLLFYFLISKPLTTLITKSILNLITIAGIFVTFIVVGGSTAPDYSISYSIAVVICSWFIKIKNSESLSANEV